jgi:hypothetical protein
MTDYPQKAVEAEFEEVDEEQEGLKMRERKSNQNLPATLETFSLIRHELKKGQTNDAIQAISEELDVDKKLGLEKQAKLTVSKSLKQDIDELTSSKDYFEVSQALLKKLFQIRKLRSQCFWHNIFAPIKAFFVAGVLPLSIHVLFLILLYPIVKFSVWIWPLAVKGATPWLVTLCIFNVIGWIGVAVVLIFGFVTWGGRRIQYALMKIKLKSLPLSEVTEKIPYGAKLKVLEAQETGIFKDFVYIAPEFEVNRKVHNILFPSIDPAILGVTGDKRMYMIVYWDIENDVEKVVKQIEHFKKFKLHKNN